jgi:hypothetical protein
MRANANISTVAAREGWGQLQDHQFRSWDPDIRRPQCMHTCCFNFVLLLMTPTQFFIPPGPPGQNVILCGEPDGRPDEFAISPVRGGPPGIFTASLLHVLTSLVLTVTAQINLPNEDMVWTVDTSGDPLVSLQFPTRCTPHVLTQRNLFRSSSSSKTRMDLRSSCGNSNALTCETDDSRLVYACYMKGRD